MPKIVIKEYDETTPGVNAESNEVVYVPGCVDATQSSLFDDAGSYIGLEPNVPTLFTNVNDFEALCGTTGLKFDRDWDYRELTYVNESGATVQAFAAEAIPYNQKIFNKGNMDPGYVLAKELLAAGLNVLFERINGGSTYRNINKTIATVTDTASLKNKFGAIPVLSRLTDSVAPDSLMKTDNQGNSVPRVVYATESITTKGVSLSDNTLSDSEITFAGGETENVSGYIPVALIESDYEYTAVNSGDNYTKDTIYVVKQDKKNESDKDEYVLLSSNEPAHNAYTQMGGTNTIFTDAAVGKVYSRTEVCTLSGTNSKITCDSTDVLHNGELYRYGTIEGCYKFDLEGTEGTSTGGSDEGGAVVYIPNNWNTTYYTARFIEVIQPAEDEYLPIPATTSSLVQTTELFEKVEGVQLDQIYKALGNCYSGEFDEDTGFTSGLADKGNYSIKYITSGGYPVYEYAGNAVMNKMLSLAATRGDCYALIDHTDNLGRTTDVNKKASVWKKLQQNEVSNGEYGAMFTPWATYTRTTTDKIGNKPDETSPATFRMPASYAYLQSLADSLNTNAPWLAVAGAARGSVKYLAEGGMTTIISNGVADAMQPRSNGTSINAITNIRPYGQTIWGNRTLKWNEENLVATSFLNIRNLVCDVKKEAYKAARALTFEQDNEVLWINFKSKIAPTLDRMLSGYGISGYKIIRNNEHKKAREKATVCARIILYPTYAVEDFYIDIVLKDSEVTVESNG